MKRHPAKELRESIILRTRSSSDPFVQQTHRWASRRSFCSLVVLLGLIISVAGPTGTAAAKPRMYPCGPTVRIGFIPVHRLMCWNSNTGPSRGYICARVALGKPFSRGVYARCVKSGSRRNGDGYSSWRRDGESNCTRYPLQVSFTTHREKVRSWEVGGEVGVEAGGDFGVWSASVSLKVHANYAGTASIGHTKTLQVTLGPRRSLQYRYHYTKIVGTGRTGWFSNRGAFHSRRTMFSVTSPDPNAEVQWYGAPARSCPRA